MPAAAGLLLDQTWRMHPELCRYTSEVFYDGKLTWVDGLDNQEILGWTVLGPARGRGAAPGQHQRLAGGGPRGGAPGGAADRPYVA